MQLIRCGSERQDTKEENSKQGWSECLWGDQDVEGGWTWLFVACIYFFLMKNPNRFHVAKETQQTSIFTLIQYVQTRSHSAPKCRTALTCTFNSCSSNYQHNYLLCPSAKWDLPKECFEVCPVFALGVLPQAQQSPCCPQRLQSTFSSALHLFLLPPVFSQWLYFAIFR